MNNGYNFIPNPSFIRNVPMMPNYVAPIPRISSLFGKGAALGNNAASTSKITFSGILNGASKTLGVINQAIPVFYQVKPIWNNARTMIRVAKGLNTPDTSKTINQVTKTPTNNQTKKEQANAPTFFA